MHIVTYMPLLILFYFSLKLLLKFINENIISLKEQIKLQSIESGILSIKDIQKDNYERFIKAIKLYLSTHNYENISDDIILEIIQEDIPHIRIRNGMKEDFPQKGFWNILFRKNILRFQALYHYRKEQWTKDIRFRKLRNIPLLILRKFLQKRQDVFRVSKFLLNGFR